MTTSVLESQKWFGQFFTGDWVAASNTQDVIEPATGQPLSNVGIATADDVYVACQQAAKAQKEWLKVPPRDKAALFHKAASFMQDRKSVV